VVTAIAAVAGIASVVAAPIINTRARMPTAYPGAIVSLDDMAVEIAGVNQTAGAAQVTYKVPVYVAIYAISDGTVLNAARLSAWQFSEAVQRMLMLFVPNAPVAGVTYWPLKPEAVEPIIADANTHGVVIRLWAEYQISVSS